MSERLPQSFVRENELKQERARAAKYDELERMLKERALTVEEKAALQKFADALGAAVEIESLSIWQDTEALDRARTEGDVGEVQRLEALLATSYESKQEALDEIDGMFPDVKHLFPSDITTADLFSDPNPFIVRCRDLAGLTGFEGWRDREYDKNKKDASSTSQAMEDDESI